MSSELCANCGAPMADDQRYCLECGTRRGDARIDYRPLLRTAPADAPARAVAGAPLPGRPSWTMTAALATIACLLLAMAIGVLIGRSGHDKVQAAAPAQVIRVSSGGGGTSTTTTPDTTTDASATSTGSASTARKTTKKRAAPKTAKPSAAVKALDQASGSDYQKQAAKLPKKVGTGGKAPPKDNKPAAGGGGFEVIG
jgi:hypothetical protein